MANLKSTAKKLQTAILHTGLVIKLNTFQIYSKEHQRMISIYALSTPALQRTKSGGWRDKDYEILRSVSVVEVVQCLNDIWQQVRK
ncbi:MAG: hypothetical protein J1E64_15005 [Acetatifactor sp.]|nr:hypothetical protein [Acetatifactor sp.]